MRAIVSVPADSLVPIEAIAEMSGRVTEWLNDPDNVAHPKPLIISEGWSVEVFDDDWNFVTRSPYWAPSEVLGEAIEMRPDRRPLLLSSAAALASLATLVLVAFR